MPQLAHQLLEETVLLCIFQSGNQGIDTCSMRGTDHEEEMKEVGQGQGGQPKQP